MMTRRSLTLLVAVSIASVLSVAFPRAGAGHEPIDWARKYTADNKTLFWKFGGTYPAWVVADATDTLQSDWSDSATNNSRIASFQSSTTGAGRVYYTTSMTSPCSGNTVWLACAKGGGTTGWEIHIRNLDTAPYGRWAWYDKTNSCATGDVCFRLQRSLIHEPIHLTLGTSHSLQDQVDTVFTANQPSYNNTGGATTLLRRCDQAAAQLAYDLREMSGPYGDCFDHLEGATASGLKTGLTVSSSSLTVCQGTAATVSGRLQVRDEASYKELGANPLAARRVTFDLDGTVGVATATATDTTAPADNWSRSFSHPLYGSRTYVAHFDRLPDSGLASSPDRTFTITWLPAKLC